MRLGKTALVHFGTQVIVSVAGFAATWVIAVLVGAGGLGEYSVVVALGFFWLAIPANAVGKAVTKRMSESEEGGPFFGSGVVLNGLIVILVGGAIVLGGEILARTVPPGRIAFVDVVTTYNVELAALVTATVAFRTVLSGLEGQKQVARTGGLQALERVFRSIALITLVALSYGVGALVLGHAAALALVAGVGLLVIARVKPSRPSRRHLRSIYEYARYAWMSTLSSRTFGWMDTLVLSFFVGTALIGIYEAAWGIASLLGMLGASIRRTLFPEVSELSADGDLEQVRHYLDEGLAFGGIFVIPGLVGAIAMGDRVLRFYRPEFAEGAIVLVLLVGAYAIDVYGAQFVDVINGVDRPEVTYRINAWFVAANVLLNLLLVPTVGWHGAALATVVSTLLRAMLAFRAVRTVLDGIRVPVRVIAFQGLAALVMGAVVVPILPRVPAGRVWTVALVGLGASTYFIALLALSGRIRQKVRMIAPVSDATDHKA